MCCDKLLHFQPEGLILTWSAFRNSSLALLRWLTENNGEVFYIRTSREGGKLHTDCIINSQLSINFDVLVLSQRPRASLLHLQCQTHWRHGRATASGSEDLPSALFIWLYLYFEKKRLCHYAGFLVINSIG